LHARAPQTAISSKIENIIGESEKSLGTIEHLAVRQLGQWSRIHREAELRVGSAACASAFIVIAAMSATQKTP
jgi:hypothetical protein